MIKAENTRDMKLDTILSYLAVAAASNPCGVDFERHAREGKLTYRVAAAIAEGTMQFARAVLCVTAYHEAGV